MEIEYLVDQGKKRRNNQDFAATFKNKAGRTLTIIADGMGGHLAGDVASRMTVEELGEFFKASEVDKVEEISKWFIQKLQIVNEHVVEKGLSNPAYAGMGTTVVAVVVLDTEFVLAHIGDSRAYVYNAGSLRQITVDHSLVQELVNQGEITPEMARVHPQKNVVTRSVGMPGVLDVDVMSLPIEENELLMLCSDGLTNMVQDEEIRAVLALPLKLAEKVNKLVELANTYGGLDNITVVLIDLWEGVAQ